MEGAFSRLVHTIINARAKTSMANTEKGYASILTEALNSFSIPENTPLIESRSLISQVNSSYAVYLFHMQKKAVRPIACPHPGE